MGNNEEKNISRSSIFRSKMKMEKKVPFKLNTIMPSGFTAKERKRLREYEQSILKDSGKEPGE